MAKAIAIKIEEDLFRDIHVRAAKQGLSIERYVTGLIELDLFSERFSDRFISLTAEQKDRLREAIHTASASARQIADTLDAARNHNGQIGSMTM